MSLGHLITLSTIFGVIWGASVFVLDLRNENRINDLEKSLNKTIVKELGKYKNVYTVDQIIDLVRGEHQKDIDDIKNIVKDDNTSQLNILKDFIEGEKDIYDTIYVEESANSKFMLLGNILWGKFYVMKKVELDKFPFE